MLSSLEAHRWPPAAEGMVFPRRSASRRGREFHQVSLTRHPPPAAGLFLCVCHVQRIRCELQLSGHKSYSACLCYRSSSKAMMPKPTFCRFYNCGLPLSLFKNLNFWRPKQWIPLGYCVLPTPDTDISILFQTADVWDFWFEPLGGFGRQAEEVKWIVPPRAAPAVKNAGVEVWWCVGVSLATPLMIYSEFDVH